MDAYVSEEDIESFENADILLTYILTLFDIMFLAISFFYIKSKNENIKTLKHKFVTIFAIDIIIRLLFIRTYYHPHTLFKELFFSSMASFQFFLILSFLDQMINDNQLSKQKNEINSSIFINSKELSLLFFLFIFSYYKFSYSFAKHFCFLQSLINIGCVFKLYEYLRDIVLVVVENISHTHVRFQNSIIYSFINNLPLSSLEFFIAYYILRIISLFIENSLYLIYIKIIIIIIKEASKYFVHFIIGAILYIVNKNNSEIVLGQNEADENTIINKKNNL